MVPETALYIPRVTSKMESSDVSDNEKNRVDGIVWRKPQRRHSQRLRLSVPLLVCGHAQDGEAFVEKTHTLTVNACGGLLALIARVCLGDHLTLINKLTRQKEECRVAYVGSDPNGKKVVGVSFRRSSTNFWHIFFPAEGVRPVTKPRKSRE